MRTNIDIDNRLMEQAMKLSGYLQKKQLLKKLLVKLDSQQKIRSFRGKLKWEGNLDQMRNDS